MRITFSVLTLLFALTFNSTLFAQHFAGGDGSSGNPWQISTPTQLDSVRFFSGDHFILMNDIDLSFDTGNPEGRFWNGGNGWEPIGFFGADYVVHFNGNGHLINGLTKGDGFPDGSGLFGTISNSSIRNLGVTNTNIVVRNFSSRVGAIAAYSDRSTIEQCFASGTISGAVEAGGLVGINRGTITNSYADVDMVNTLGLTGGLVGDNSLGTIIKSYSVGVVDIGSFFVENNFAITKSGNVEDSFYNAESVGPAYDSHKGSGLKTSVMIDERTILRELDFSETGAWTIKRDTTYPYLKWQVEPDSINYPTKTPQPLSLIARSRPNGAEIYWNSPSTETPIGYNIYRWNAKINEELITKINFADSTTELGVENVYQISSVYEIDGDTVESNRTHIDKVISGFFDGRGNESDPYRLSEMEQFRFIDQYPDLYYGLGSNINAASTKDWNEGKGFKPVKNFSGYFDAGGAFIDSLYINRPNQDSMGVFASSEGTINNLGLTNVFFVGNDNLGGIAGINTGTIENVYVTGAITGNSNVGGIAGKSSGVLSTSYTDVSVEGEEAIGGIVGLAENQQINETYTIGEVNGTTSGPIIGDGQSAIPNTNFWNNTSIEEGEFSNLLGIALDENEMRSSTNFSGFDFMNHWEIIEDFTFPFLRNNIQDPLPGLIIPFTGGDGSVENPYQISANNQFSTVRYFLDKHFVLINNLDLTFDTSNPEGLMWNEGKGWTPIGSVSVGFSGSIDGKGYTINGISILNDKANFVGVFHTIEEEGSVHNMVIDSLTVLGLSCSGGLASRNYGTISKVGVTGNISIIGEAGGIVCVNETSGTISESFFKGTVSSKYISAGSIASHSYGEISDTYSISDIIGGTQFIGAPNAAGGIVSYLGKSTSLATLQNSFHVGTVNGLGSKAGLIYTNRNSTISNSYWDKEISEIEIGVVVGDSTGTSGLTSSQMRNQSSFTDWDFETVWVMQPFAKYPTLRWNPETFELPLPDSVELISPAMDDWFPIWEATFVWSSSEFAESYLVELAKDSSFQSMVFSETVVSPDTTLQVEDGTLESDVRYYWRVKAINNTGESSWSEVHRFDGNGGLSNESDEGLPTVFNLSQNYPNPFNPSTAIKFDLPETSIVSIKVFDMLGREVATLIDDRIQAGYHQLTFDASALASGMYIYRIVAGDYISTKKMLLIK